MTSPPIQHDKSMLHKWLGPNPGTHWIIAGSVVVILLGSYFVYSNQGNSLPTAAVPATEQAPVPAPSAPVMPKQ